MRGNIIMGLLLLVIRKSWSFIALSLAILASVFIVNYDPLASHPLISHVLNLQTIQKIRSALNPCIPIIAAVIVGIFVQGVGLIYRLFEDAVRRHLRELNEVAQFFINKLQETEKPAYFTNSIRAPVIDGYILYMYIEAPLCEHYEDIKSRYGDLVEDIGNHWRRAGEVINEVVSLCKDIAQHNRSVKELEQRLLGDVQKLVMSKAISRLPGLIPDYFKNFMRFVLLGIVIPRVVKENQLFKQIECDFIAHAYKSYTKDFKVDPDSSGILRVGGYSVGRITPDEWREHGEKLVIEIAYKVLKEHHNQLDKHVEEGMKLIEQAKKVTEKLEKELDNIAKARFLPLTKICRYLG